MSESLPKTVGVGFKPAHHTRILEDSGVVRWFEIHAENYMSSGGLPNAQLAELRTKFPISLHGVGLSLGGELALDKQHLERLKNLIDWLRPAQISEHIAWSVAPGQFLNDLLPINYGNPETLERLCRHVDETQQFLGCQLLIENPSSYLCFDHPNYVSSAIETDFINEVITKTGCALLLDVNNIYVSCENLCWSTASYLDGIDFAAVKEIHLAGYAEDCDSEGVPVLIDNHGAATSEPVWQLYQKVLSQTGSVPTLIEWDQNLPDWSVLHAEAEKAHIILQSANPVSGMVA